MWRAREAEGAQNWSRRGTHGLNLHAVGPQEGEALLGVEGLVGSVGLHWLERARGVGLEADRMRHVDRTKMNTEEPTLIL